MKIRRTRRFDRNYSKAPKNIQRAFDKQAILLLQNLRHPSLRTKSTMRLSISGKRESLSRLALLFSHRG